MKNLWISLRLVLWMTIVTGILYPLVIWGFAQLVVNQKSTGDIIVLQGQKVGAYLIAQKFEEAHYFWGRPSATNYNPIPSGGSNLGPTSAALKKIVDDRTNAVSMAHPINALKKIPGELLFASASGIDPHISPQTAIFQIDRILKARETPAHIGRQEILNLITENTEGRRFGFIGKPVVNVLVLNIALDNLYKK